MPEVCNEDNKQLNDWYADYQQLEGSSVLTDVLCCLNTKCTKEYTKNTKDTLCTLCFNLSGLCIKMKILLWLRIECPDIHGARADVAL